VEVFRSYSRRDRAFVDRVVPDLESRGHVVWRDIDDLAGGEAWREGIPEAIRRSEVVVVVVSPSSVESRNVSKELSVAEERRKRIIPILHRPAELRGAIELHLTDLQYVDFTSGYDTGLRTLLAALGGAPVPGAPLRRSTEEPGPRRRRWLIPVAAVAAAVVLVLLVVALTRPDGQANEGTATTATSVPPTTLAPSTSGGGPPASENDDAPVSVRTLAADEMVVTASSSLSPQSGCGSICSYGPENLVDGSIATAWSEGQTGTGAGAWVEVDFAEPQRIVVMSMWPGWQRGEPCLFERNARPQDVLVTFDGQRSPWLIPNEAGQTSLELDLVTSSVRFDFRESYPGSEIEFAVAPS
jgi:TIR domain